MQENRISIKITPAEVATVQAAIATIKTTLAPYLVALTPDERRRLPKMSDGSLPFVQKALDYAQNNSVFVPAYIDVPELAVDVAATEILLDMERPMEQLTALLSDTIMLCGSEAYIASLGFYNSVKQAAKMKVPEAEVISDDLFQRFSRATGGSKLPDPPKAG